MTICAPCATAADWVSNKPQQPNIVNAARDLHSFCKGCDCQHKVDAQLAGKAIQR